MKTSTAWGLFVLAFAFAGAIPASAQEPEEDDGWTTVIECRDAAVKHYRISDMSFYRVETAVPHGSHYQHRRRPRMPIITFDAEKLTLKVNGKLCGRWN